MNSSISKRWAKEEPEIPVHEEIIPLTINGRDVDFELIHNLNFFHLDIHKAIAEWSKQTLKASEMDFCRYVMSQPFGKKKLVCIPKVDWLDFQLNNEVNFQDRDE